MIKVDINDINDNVKTEIVKVLNKGFSCEIKREKDNIVVVELKRKVKIKSPVIDKKA